MTAIEAIINMMVTGALLASIGGIVTLSVRMLGSDDRVGDPPQRVVQRELARASERMLVLEKCDSPSTAVKYSECLELAEVPFPNPSGALEKQGQNTLVYGPLPDWHKNQGHENVVCWMVEGSRDRSGANKDTRDLECWYHIPTDGVIFASFHSPSSSTSSKDEFEPKWKSEPYSVARIAEGVERLGYCTTTEAGLPIAAHDTKAACEAVNGQKWNGNEWRLPWECVEGIDPDPESAVQAKSVVSALAYQPQACSKLVGGASEFGTAVLTLRMCVSMSDAELNRRTRPREVGQFRGLRQRQPRHLQSQRRHSHPRPQRPLTGQASPATLRSGRRR